MGRFLLLLAMPAKNFLPSLLLVAAAALSLVAPCTGTLLLQTGTGGCQHKPFDLVMVLDSSSSLGPKQWQQELQFAIGLIDGLPIAEDLVR